MKFQEEDIAQSYEEAANIDTDLDFFEQVNQWISDDHVYCDYDDYEDHYKDEPRKDRKMKKELKKHKKATKKLKREVKSLKADMALTKDSVDKNTQSICKNPIGCQFLETCQQEKTGI